MKQILIALALLIAVGIVAIISIVSYASHDLPEPDVSDLVVNRPSLHPDDNACTFFNSATHIMFRPTNSAVVTDYLDGASVAPQAVAEVIAKNEDALGHMTHGIECRRCITPEVTGFDTLLPYIGPWLDMSRILAAKTRHDRLAGRYVDATETCMTHLAFADLIQRDAEGILNYLVGIAVLDHGLTQARDLARDPGISSTELKKLSDTLAGLGPFAPGLIRAIKVEYKVVANTIDDLDKGVLKMDDLIPLTGSAPPAMLRGTPIPGYFFHPNRTKLAFANLYRDMIDNAQFCYGEMSLYDVEEMLDLGGRKSTLLTRPNAVGRILYALLMPASASHLERKCRAECDVAATRLLVGNHAYRRDTSAYPKSLSDLVPAYLDAIPDDPYDGQPFRYDPQKRIVYSVGKDGLDSGGSSVLLSGSASESVQHKRWYSEDVVYEIEEIHKASPPK